MVLTKPMDGDLVRARSEYVDALERGDRRDAIQTALDLLYRGFSAESVLTELVAFGQTEVGEGWQHGRWSVTQEHRASAVAEAVIQAVAQHAVPIGQSVVEGSAGHVVVACAEGEWHVLPGRLVSEVLRIRGFDVDFVGPSVPAGDLATFLGPGSPTTVAISCSMPMSLVGAWHTITALRAAGKTVVCGGRGFGPDGRWGQALGADLWAGDIDTGARLLRDAVGEPPTPPRPEAVAAELVAEVNLAVRELPRVVEAAAHLANVRWPELGRHPDWIRAGPELLTFTGWTIVASTLVGDEAVVTEHVAWAESVLDAREMPRSLIAEAFSLLAAALPADLPRCLSMTRVGVAACSEAPRVSGLPTAPG